MSSQRPNVWMIGWEYPPHNSGGLGVACQGLTEAMAASDNITFTLPYALPETPSHMEVVSCFNPAWSQPSDQPPFLAYGHEASVAPSIHTLDRHELAKLPQSELEHKVSDYSELVVAAAEDHQFDVIHAHDWMSFPAAAQLQKTSGKPFIAHVHSTELDRIPNGGGSRYIGHTEYQGMMAADKVIAVSHYTKRLLIREYQIPAHKIEVVHNGMIRSAQIDPGPHHFASRRPVIVFMGRLTDQKGPYHYLLLAKRVLQDLPEALFVMAGHGDMYHQLLLKTAQERLSASVLFSGFVRGAHQAQLLDRADIFVMPSLSEPFGLVALEAAERHTPVIVSKNAGVAEVLPSAVQVDFWDIERMATEIKTLLTNSQRSTRIINNQLKELEKVTWKSAAQKINQIYRQTFAGK